MGKTSNEQLCAALITHGTIKKAAEALNIAEGTAYNMMNDAAFISMYASVQRKLLNGAILTCQSKMHEAINCMANIMNDETLNAQTRLQAAQALLKNGAGMMQLSDSLKKREKNIAEWGNASPCVDYDYEDGPTDER